MISRLGTATVLVRTFWHTTLVHCRALQAGAEKVFPMTHRIIGDGNHGYAGSNGRNGGWSETGQHGTDATPGGPGARASDINLHLTSDNQTVAFASHINGGHFSVRADDTIVVRSHGGNGGAGGSGGDGARGVRGAPGRAATQSSRGTNGGPGGPGGDAGNGANGGDAGDGGRIEINCARRDAYLLMVVDGLEEPNGWANGGHGGSAGSNGRPGPGGYGGAGGAACHWTTTSTTGSGENQKTVTHHHSQPGGSQGPSGPSGRSASAHPRNGSDGRDGSVAIVVDGQHYSKRYELAVADFDVLATGTPATPMAATDGIFEFGEVCHARHVTLSNKSGAGRMASPTDQRVRVRLQPNVWVRPSGEDVFCAQSIWAGTTSSRISGVIPFQINYDPRCGYRPGGATTEFAHEDLGKSFDAHGQDANDFDPIVASVEAHAIAAQLGIEDASGSGSSTLFQREYVRGHKSQYVTAQFPVRNNGGLVGLNSLANGEASNLTLEIENISSQSIGRDFGRRGGCAQTRSEPSYPCRIPSTLRPSLTAALRLSLYSRTQPPR